MGGEESPEPSLPTAAVGKEGMPDGSREGAPSLDGASDQALWFPVVIFFMSLIHVSFISLTLTNLPQLGLCKCCQVPMVITKCTTWLRLTALQCAARFTQYVLNKTTSQAISSHYRSDSRVLPVRGGLGAASCPIPRTARGQEQLTWGCASRSSVDASS